MRLLIEDQQSTMKQWPRLLVKDLNESQDFSRVKFQKIEFCNQLPLQAQASKEYRVSICPPFYKNSIGRGGRVKATRQLLPKQYSFIQLKSNIDLKYPKAQIQQHQFLDRVKDLRRRAIQGRMKSKFQKSYKKLDITKPSNFNPQPIHNREQPYGSLQEIQVVRTFQRDRTYYQRPFEKMNSDLTDSPSEPSYHFLKSKKKIIVARPKWQQFVQLQLNRYKPKSFEQIKRDSIINILSETKETMPQTPAVKVRNLHKLQPYFSIPKQHGRKKNSLTSLSYRIKTTL